MAYFAELDNDNLVTRVLVTDDAMPNKGLDWLLANFGGTWVQTFEDGGARKNFASVGVTYNRQLDAFIEQKPYPSWELNDTTCKWEAPVAQPEDGKPYTWNELTGSWLEVIGDN